MTAILPMILENIELYTRLYSNVFKCDPWREIWPYSSARQRIVDIMETPQFLGFELRDNDELLGLIAGHSKHTYSGSVFYIAEFCVTNKFQGKGYGSQLLAFLEKRLRENNVASLFLITEHTGSINTFYRNKGYSINSNRIVMNKDL
ncbi:MAG: GNAT family N-acetyltransferase [Sporolactobacillus sp.]